jgi:hypothetical protein
MPITNSLHERLKEKLPHNLTKLAELKDHKGRKLRFDPTTGEFEHETDGKERTERNKGSATKDSATSKDMFAYPILVTMYECRKLVLKSGDQKNPINSYSIRLGTRPETAWTKAYNGLVYLHHETYANVITGFRQRSAIKELLGQVEKLGQAQTASALYELIARWVDFATPPDGGGKFPTEQEWLAGLMQAHVALTPPLTQVRHLLSAYAANSKRNGAALLATPEERRFVREYLRVDIYLTLCHVLEQTGGQVPAVVRQVYDLAEEKCCRILKVGKANLKAALKQKLLRTLYDEEDGTVPPNGMRANDGAANAYYLNKAARKKYQLFFKDGLIYQFPWGGPAGPWSDNAARADDEVDYSPLGLVLANSAHAIVKQVLEDLRNNAGMPRKEVMQALSQYQACFVVGFKRDFYMAQHQNSDGGRRSFNHSAYFAGKPVLFAGGIIVQKGRLKRIDDCSGHYRPRPEHMVSVLEALLMHGVSLLGVSVLCRLPVGTTYDQFGFDAQFFLARRGRVTAAQGTRLAVG